MKRFPGQHSRLVLPVVFSSSRVLARDEHFVLSRQLPEKAMSLLGGLVALEDKTPQTYLEAVNSEDSEKWKESMQEEIDSCEKQGTWVVVDRASMPLGAIEIPNKWVYKIKTNEHGNVTKHKSRITPKGFKQRKGLEYFEVFAHTGKYKSLRVLLFVVAVLDLELNQLDVPSAFVRADLEEEVYMSMPDGFKQEGKVYLLKKSLYGLKQSPRNWYLLCSGFIKGEMGFFACISDPCLFYKISRTGNVIIIFLFVDDMQGAYRKVDEQEWQELKKQLYEKFEVKDLPESTWMLGMMITRDRKSRTLKLDQSLYISKMLEKYGLTDCKPAKTPAAQNHGAVDDARDGGDEDVEVVKYQELVGSLLYSAISTRPDISYAVNMLTRQMVSPKMRDWNAGKRVLRYLAGTREKGLWFGPRGGHEAFPEVISVSAFSDSDWGCDKHDRKSITGWIAMLNGNPVSWASKKQRTVAQSSCEAELYAASSATNEMIWLRSLLKELGFNIGGASQLWVDNQGTIEVAKHGVKSERTKHIDIRYHHITDCIEKKMVKVDWVKTSEQQADIMTKALALPQFEPLKETIMTHD
jgi:hypothetical protein